MVIAENLRRAMEDHIEKGFRVAEKYNEHSVALIRKRLFFKTRIFLWLDDRSKVIMTTCGLSHLQANLAQKVKMEKVLGKFAVRFWPLGRLGGIR